MSRRNDYSLHGYHINVSYAGEDLSGRILSGTYIGVNFNNTNLQGAHLMGTFIGSSFEDADIDGADVSSARLIATSLPKSGL